MFLDGDNVVSSSWYVSVLNAGLDLLEIDPPEPPEQIVNPLI